MKRNLMLIIMLMALLVLTSCVKHSTLICDKCGKTFEGDDDYSKQLAREEEIMSALGIDLYSFFCDDCNDRFATCIAYKAMTPEDAARLEAYDAGKEIIASVGVDANVEILGPTDLDQYYIAEDNLTGLYGIYDISLNIWKTEPIFSAIYAFDANGLALAMKNDYYGYIDSNGNTVIGFQFLEADPFTNGVARVRVNKWGVIDTEGSFVVDPMYEGISIYDNGYISVCDGEWYGLCDPTGRQIIDIKFLEGFKFTESRIYACCRIEKDNNRFWYKLFDYEGNNLMDALSVKNSQYVSYPYENVQILCYKLQEIDNKFYNVLDENLNVIFGDGCAYISEFSSFGYAVAISTPTYSISWGNVELNYEGLFVIDKSGTRVCHLPNLPSYDTQYSSGGSEWRYTYDFYVNEYCAIAMGGSSGYLINLQTLEYSQWKRIVPLKDSNYVMVQDKNTELWSLYNGDNLIEDNCTNIEYSDSGINSQFKLYHGNEYILYPS